MEKFFTKDPSLIYLNTGSHSIIPNSVLNKQIQYTRDYEINPTKGLFGNSERFWQVQQKVAGHFHADPLQISLRCNVTQLLNEYILGVHLPAGSEILTSDHEYGAIFNICKYRAKKDDLALSIFSLPALGEIGTVGADELYNRVVDKFTPSTRLVVLSEIYTGSGLRLPIVAIAREARRRGILTIVDAAHSPGFLPVDFRELLDIDFYAGNLHKWWMGPKGTAFGWVHPDREDDLIPLQVGWTSFETPEPFLKFAGGDRFAVSQLMLGCYDFAPFYALVDAVDFWETIGAQAIFSRRQVLGNLVVQQMGDKLPRYASQDIGTQGPMYAYRLPSGMQSMSFTGLVSDLRENLGVQISITFINGEKYVRMSPHIHNTEDEIGRAASLLLGFFKT